MTWQDNTSTEDLLLFYNDQRDLFVSLRNAPALMNDAYFAEWSRYTRLAIYELTTLLVEPRKITP